MNLFEQVVEESKIHPNFKSILKINDGFSFDVLMDWARKFEDRDGKFVKEFQTSFNPCFWELYIFAVLKRFGYRVDFSHASPDFYIPAEKFCIEATISSNPLSGAPEHLRHSEMPPADLNEFNRKAIIRLSNSIQVKYSKYTKSYSKLEHVKDIPFVVAVSNFDQPYSFMSAQRPIEALLHDSYVDETEYLNENSSSKILGGKSISSVKKDNGSEIYTGMFNSDTYKDISAVIYTSCANWGKVRALSSGPGEGLIFTAIRQNMSEPSPIVEKAKKRNYTETLLDGLRVYHNPYAAIPLDPKIFQHKDIFQSYYCKSSQEWIFEQREGQLLFRSTESSIRN